jgi:isoprenylcysteine carboxyl methyltransferase (ICMT) family protein YpbQ
VAHSTGISPNDGREKTYVDEDTSSLELTGRCSFQWGRRGKNSTERGHRRVRTRPSSRAVGGRYAGVRVRRACSGMASLVSPFLVGQTEHRSGGKSTPSCPLGRTAGCDCILDFVAEPVLGETGVCMAGCILHLFFLLATLLSWTGAHSLGRQWRIDAGLNPNHELVTSGPYRVVRHPIYTSMLCLLIATGCLITPIPVLLPSIVVLIAGTEIRVRIEHKLLAYVSASGFENISVGSLPIFRSFDDVAMDVLQYCRRSERKRWPDEIAINATTGWPGRDCQPCLPLYNYVLCRASRRE